MSKVKMTRAIAYDYLRGKKVKMDVNPIYIQTLVQKIGFRWSEASTKMMFKDVYGICLGQDGYIRYCEHHKAHEWDGYLWDEISAMEVNNIEIVDE